jgi:hypothetical protein
VRGPPPPAAASGSRHPRLTQNSRAGCTGLVSLFVIIEQLDCYSPYAFDMATGKRPESAAQTGYEESPSSAQSEKLQLRFHSIRARRRSPDRYFHPPFGKTGGTRTWGDSPGHQGCAFRRPGGPAREAGSGCRVRRRCARRPGIQPGRPRPPRGRGRLQWTCPGRLPKSGRTSRTLPHRLIT